MENVCRYVMIMCSSKALAAWVFPLENYTQTAFMHERSFSPPFVYIGKISSNEKHSIRDCSKRKKVSTFRKHSP